MTVIKSARKGSYVFAEQSELGVAQSGRLGHERKAVLYWSRDSRLGHCLLRTTAHGSRGCSEKLYAAIAKDFKRRGNANRRSAVLLQIRHWTRSSRAHVPISEKLLQPLATCRRGAAWKDTGMMQYL
jgi:hypothetical protein